MLAILNPQRLSKFRPLISIGGENLGLGTVEPRFRGTGMP